MIITQIERNKKNKERMSVYVDGSFCFSVSEEAYLRLHLYEEKEISLQEIENIIRYENFNSAKSQAVKYLSFKHHSEREVLEKLDSEGFDKETILDAIEELKSIGYINDKLYVQKYLYDRMKLKPKSKKMLKYELQNKGIPGDIIDEILVSFEVDDSDVATSIAKKKFGKYSFQDENIIKKVHSFLRHRGFSFEVIQTTIENIRRSSDL